MRKTMLLSALLLVAVLVPSTILAQGPIRFGVPPWPGVTVKTAVVTQILEAMGYETRQFEVGPPIIYEGLTKDEVDAYVAAWIPLQNKMFLPLKEAGKITVAGTNLDEAGASICVPDYVWDGGVKTLADLDKYADKFNHDIHGIEAGSGMHTTTEQLIDNDVVGLGDWEQIGSTTPAMLTVVQDKIRSKEWVAFHCWRPHWMNIVIDMKYLEGVPGTEELVTKSIVYTVVSNDFKDKYPEAFAFLKNFYVKGDTQSKWIHSFGYEKISAEQVASDWIKANMDTVAGWLKGVKTADGSKPAIEAVKAAYN